ncbi:hypothetical protein AV521_31270 [Streptomyces sp. IMTB 2501]|uniref:Lrp/AsnC ligand binding domain-containing protein n=1 Tax=Streptomyces sp. IMTB 2501 TaxID=1776340 RepID=UPI00097003BD|nr:hypothetical protein AV521_31270 [Streptomyces sp. IMTB 2501]
MGFEVPVFVHLRHSDRQQLAAFDEGLVAIPEVNQAERLFGTPGYLLRVETEDLDAYQRLFEEQRANTNQLMSTIVMRRVIATRPMPIQRKPPPQGCLGDRRPRIVRRSGEGEGPLQPRSEAI